MKSLTLTGLLTTFCLVGACVPTAPEPFMLKPGIALSNGETRLQRVTWQTCQAWNDLNNSTSKTDYYKIPLLRLAEADQQFFSYINTALTDKKDKQELEAFLYYTGIVEFADAIMKTSKVPAAEQKCNWTGRSVHKEKVDTESVENTDAVVTRIAARNPFTIRVGEAKPLDLITLIAKVNKVMCEKIIGMLSEKEKNGSWKERKAASAGKFIMEPLCTVKTFILENKLLGKHNY